VPQPSSEGTSVLSDPGYSNLCIGEGSE